MAGPIVTLTTDFGDNSTYVAAMTGSLLRVCPSVRVHHLSHEIPAHDVRAAARFLVPTLPFWPDGTVHVVVVDPGVGGRRAALMVDFPTSVVLAPDNGCWTSLIPVLGKPTVRRLENPRYWNRTVAPTFHGRDIFVPVAGHRLNGVDAARFGPTTETWVTLEAAGVVWNPAGTRATIERIDRFGNAITDVREFTDGGAMMIRLSAAETVRDVRRVRTYADARPGECVILTSSDGALEIAVVEGSAAAALGLTVGAAVELASVAAGGTKSLD